MMSLAPLSAIDRVLTGSFLALSFLGFVRLAPGITSWQPVDFAVNYNAAVALNENPRADLYDIDQLNAKNTEWGADYDRLQYTYPPFVAVMLRPLASLPYRTAVMIWLGVNLGLVGALAILFLKLGGLEISPGRLAAATATCLMFYPVTWSLVLGQINVLVAALVAGAVYCVGRSRADARDALGGFLLGVAASIKVYPAVLLIPLGLRRRWLALSWAIVAIAGCGIIGVIGAGGRENSLRFLKSPAPQTFSSAISSEFHINQSLFAAVRRLVTPHVYRFAVFETDHLFTLKVNPIVDAPALARPLTIALNGTLSRATLVILVRSRRVIADGMRLSLSLILLLALIVFAWVPDHWHTLLLIPWAVLIASGREDRLALRLCLLAAFLVAVHRFWRPLAFAGVPVGLVPFGLLGVLVTWVALARLLLGHDRATAST